MKFRRAKVTTGDHSKGPNGRERARFGAAQGVPVLAIVHEVSFVAARQVQLARERFARVEFAITRLRITIWRARNHEGRNPLLVLTFRDGARTRMTARDRIEVNPRVMLGKPVIRGTRIPVELIVRKLGEGATEDELLDAYPRLTPEDLHPTRRYAGTK